MEVSPSYVDGSNNEFQTSLSMNLLKLQGLGHLTILRLQRTRKSNAMAL